MLEKYYRLNEAAGVSLYIRADGLRIWSYCRVEVKNDQLTITERATELTEAQLFEKLKKGIPVALNLSGKGILHKDLPRMEEIGKNEFHRILPNADPDGFYIQNFISGDSSFLSIIRRIEAEKTLTLFAERDLPVLMLTFGPFVVQQVIPQLNFYHAEVFAGQYLIQRNENGEWENWYENLKDIQPPHPVRLASDFFDHRLLPAYAGAFQLVLNDTLPLIESTYEEGMARRLRFLTQRKFRTYGAGLLAAFFVLLLINFVWFSSLNTTNNQLAEAADRSARTSSDLQQLSQDIAGQQALLQVLGWDGGKSKARMADMIASLMPEEISLSSLGVQPPDAVAARLQHSLQFKSKVIEAIGTCDRVMPVNEWIARLKAQQWVRDAHLDSYVFDPEGHTGRFLIHLDY